MPIFEEIVFEKYGVRIKEKRNYLIETENDLPWSKLEKCFHLTYERWDECIIYPGVRRFLHELYDQSDNDPIRIITARPAHIAANNTYKLCERFDVPFELVITGMPQMVPGQPDLDKFNYLHRYTFFVDDRRKTAIDLSKKGKYIYMPTQAYNDLNGVDYTFIKEINSVVDLQKKLHWFTVEV